MALDESVAPPKATHLTLETVLKPASGWSLQLEGYYKRLLHQLSINYTATSQAETSTSLQDANFSEFIDSGTPLPSQTQSSFLSSGSGYAYGFSFYVDRKRTRLYTKLGYEFSHAARSFGEQFDGRTVVTPWNEPHRLEFSTDIHATDHLVMQARWQSVWGRSWGFWQSYYDFIGAYGRQLLELTETPRTTDDIEGYDLLSVPMVVDHIRAYRLGHPEEHHLPALHQLDLSLAYTHTIRTIHVQARADVVNVMNFSNVADWGLVSDPEEGQTTDGESLLTINERHMLPVTPSLALRLTW